MMPAGSEAEASSWGQSDNLFYGVARAHRAIPAGVYRPGSHPSFGICLAQVRLETDTLVRLPDTAADEVVREIREFRGLKPMFDRFGFLHKRGVMLWGPPGGGKTVCVEQTMEIIVGEEGGIGVLADEPTMTAAGLQLIRRIEPERPIVCVFEDIDALTNRHGEAEYLALLDGEAQVDGITFVATTNFPEKLSDRFRDRPSRFDTVRYIGMPTAAARGAYLRAKLLPVDQDADIEELVRVSDGFSIAHLRELIVLTRCFGKPLDEAVARLRKMSRVKPSSERSPDREDVGFGGRVAYASLGPA
jgi:SpoVK/Ycf46/Vps4 family AAA+-type ATPase